MDNTQNIQRDIALWVIRLNCDDPVARLQVQQEFEQWKAEHPEYLDYFEELKNFNTEMQNLPHQHHINAQTIQHTFQAIEKEQPKILEILGKTTFILAGISCIGYLFYAYFPLQYYTADYRTGIAESRNLTLPDGSKITLSAKSAIKLDYSTHERRIHLIQGDIYIDVAKDKTRPLVVQTAQADFQALGTQFIVNRYPTRSTLSMLHSEVKVSLNNDLSQQAKPSQTQQSQVIRMGEQIQVNQHGLGKVEHINPASVKIAWQQHQILANDLPLSDLLSRLNAYYDSYIIFDQEGLSDIKVTGVINTQQDLNETLRLLKTQYPQIDFIQVGKFVTYARIKKSG
ncbi:MAG: FecR domain-containing protein [Acinetobacter populi]|jgi:transmembrane sensor|uniref:FecR family protein n=1 Tax=Acinetobacter populi TaxID=1582270 RepID=UPI00235580F6|nr:FecR domain-containing protein [Acinetobacter populi]MCH4248938.1 FecR domain-containing protein [Acinetobacter populi]